MRMVTIERPLDIDEFLKSIVFRNRDNLHASIMTRLSFPAQNDSPVRVPGSPPATCECGFLPVIRPDRPESGCASINEFLLAPAGLN